MNRCGATAALAVLGMLMLTGCTTVAVGADSLDIGGRAGAPAARPLDYSALMRIGAAAQQGGDLANALGIYRRAAALNPHAAQPFAAAGNTLMQMGRFNEAIVSYDAALVRSPRNPVALRGLARAYLRSGKPELAARPLAIAYRETPNDPKLLQLIGVTKDFAGQHEAAQARYRHALDLLPKDPGLSVDLALSLALAGRYADAIAVLRPLAAAAASTMRERQTLALIYGLQGDRPAAERLARLDLDPAAVQHNLAYYDTLRALSPEARARAIEALGTRTVPAGPT
jgi:Flp pilus assembly protein TadD